MNTMHEEDLENKSIFLYDGECGFCNKTVMWLIDHSYSGTLYFAPIQSGKIKEFLNKAGVGELSLASSWLLHQGKIYGFSEAILRSLKFCRFPWRLASVFLFVPRGVRDFGYNFIAKRRMLIVKSQSCVLPNEEQLKRFL